MGRTEDDETAAQEAEKVSSQGEDEADSILRLLFKVQNFYQDVEDVFDDSTTTTDEKLAKIKELNRGIGKIVAELLPG